MALKMRECYNMLDTVTNQIIKYEVGRVDYQINRIVAKSLEGRHVI